MGNELTTCHGVRNHLTLTCTQSCAKPSPFRWNLPRPVFKHHASGCPKRQPQGHRFGPLPSLWGSSYRQRRWAGAECALLPHWGWVKTHDFPYERGMNIDNYKLFNLDLRNRVNWQIAVWRMYCKGFKMFQPIFGSNTRIYIYVITYMYYHGGFSSVRLWECGAPIKTSMIFPARNLNL